MNAPLPIYRHLLQGHRHLKLSYYPSSRAETLPELLRIEYSIHRRQIAESEMLLHQRPATKVAED